VLTLVHLLGTGENVYAPLPGLLALCRAEPRLRACRHVFVDTPSEAACFLGPHEFATRLRRVLAPELRRNPEGVVLVGLSRGGAAALDIGAGLAVEGVRVSVLALSAPLARPARAPLTVLNIGVLESATEHYVHAIELMPWWTAVGDFLFRRIYIRFTGFVLAELNMSSEASIAMYARYIHSRDPKQACLRAVREFALLGRVSDAELRHAVSGITSRLAAADNARMILCWGRDDAWVDVEPCVARVRAAIEREHLPAGRVTLHVLDGVNHGISREAQQDVRALAALLWQACEHVALLPAASESRPPRHEHTESNAS
jgi:pimeloyl-ACP methyl ester carboxylesterase